MLIRMKSGDAHFLDYREKAPAAATANMYLDAKGNVVPGLSTLGYKSIGVPGTVAGLVYAQKHYGKLSLARVMAPAIRLATEGYVLSARRSEQPRPRPQRRQVPRLPPPLPARRQLLQDRRPLHPTRTRRHAQAHRRRSRDFYKGAMAAELAAAIQKGGGLITAADLAAYEVKDREPLIGSYRGYDIITAPPPSSGGIVLLEILNILSGYDLGKMGDRTPAASPPHHRSLPPRLHGPRRLPRRSRLRPHSVQQMIAPAYAAAWRKTIDPVAPSPSPRSSPRRLPASPAARAHTPRTSPADHPLLRRRRRR